MPLYEFLCKNCSRVNERLMKISDPAPVECEFCRQGPLVKKMSKTSFVLKGQGWYETDFKNKGKPATKSADSAASSAQAESSASSAESKPAASEGQSSPSPVKE